MPDAAASGTFTIGGDLPVHRLGYGAMRITGDGIWGPPDDRDRAKAVLRRVVDLGVTLIDTADSYGPDVSEELIAEALHPYPDDVVIATKAGLERTGPGEWPSNGHPDHTRKACDGSLRKLRVDTIDLYQLHRPDPDIPFEEQLGAFVELREQGKIRHIGLSNVTVEQLDQAQAMVEITSVQNRFNLTDRTAEDVLDACTGRGLAFLPWFPIATGDLADGNGPLADIARDHNATPTQVALAWLLHRSPVILPIPGTSSLDHLEENVGAADLELSTEEVRRLTDER